MGARLATALLLGLALGCADSGGGKPPAGDDPSGLAGRWVGSGDLDGVALVLGDSPRGTRYSGTYERREPDADAWVDAGEALAESRGGGLVRFWFGSGGVLRWVEGERDPSDPGVVTGPAGRWQLVLEAAPTGPVGDA